MENIFNANYFDGISSSKKNALVEPRKEVIRITIFDFEGHKTERFWSIDKIEKEAYSSKEKLVFLYNSKPKERLEIYSPEIISLINNNYHYNKITKEHFSDSIARKGSLLILLLVSVVSLGFLFYWKGLPFLADKVANNLPDSFEQNMGNGIRSSLLSSEEIDTTKTNTLQLFFNELNYAPKNTVSVYLVKSDVVNAFALPGGTIVVYEGLLNKLTKPSQLAALLGHEYAHVYYRHSMRGMIKNIAGVWLISIYFGDSGGVIGGLIENANQFRQLTFSREFEVEADEKGMEFMTKNGIDNKGLKELLQILKEQQETTSSNLEIPEFLSTHPLTENRIKNAESKILNSSTSKENPKLQSLFNSLIEETVY